MELQRQLWCQVKMDLLRELNNDMLPEDSMNYEEDIRELAQCSCDTWFQHHEHRFL